MQLALRGVSGKQHLGAVSRRSIPDVEPVSDGPTLYEDPMFIEELDASELVDSGSGRARISVDHGTDYDDATLAVPPPQSPKDATLLSPTAKTDPPTSAPPGTTAPQTPQMAGRPSVEPPRPPSGPPRPTPRPPTQPIVQVSVAPASPQLQRPPTPAPLTAQMPTRGNVLGSTLIMESPIHASEGRQMTVEMTSPRTEPTPFGQRTPSVAPQQVSLAPRGSLPPQTPQRVAVATPHHLTPTDPPGVRSRSSAEELVYQPPRRPRPPQSGTSRALLFVGITIVTMIVVIVAGLLVLHYGD